MTTVPQTPARWLTEAEIEAFHTDGAVVLRDVISAQWLAQIEEGVEYVLAHPSVLAEATAVLGGGGFSGDAFMWKTHQVFHDFIHHSPAARLAQQLFGSRRINAFYDQIFAKPAGNGKPTPFHEDVSSWPVSGDQLCAMWIALDPCTPDQAALQVVRGSHRWPPGRAIPVTPTAADLQLAGQSGDRDAEVTELLSWELEPGDLVLFHPRAVHGATGTGSERGRRAFVSRWAGDDVVFDPRHAVLPLLWEHGLKPGDPIGGSMFPQVLPAQADGTWCGPEQPDAAKAADFIEILRLL